MSSSKGLLTEREEKDLKKFITFFSLKTIQVIVQSRSGSKIKTKSKINSDGIDWFNVAIPDDLSIKSQVRKLLAQDVPSLNQPITIDVSLETSEGDKMVLESWTLGVSEAKDTSAKVHYAVYNRMGLILKSIICVTRSVPAYKLVKRQMQSDYKVLSKIFVGENRLSSLGQDFQTMQIGVIPTPKETLTLSVAYRTNLAMSVQQLNTSTAEVPIKVADNHFSNNSPKRNLVAPMPFQSVAQSEISINDGSQEMWSSLVSTSPTTSSSNGRMSSHDKSDDQDKLSLDIQSSSQSSSSSGNQTDLFSGLSSSTSLNKHLGAFASMTAIPEQLDIELVPEDTPFESLLQASIKPKQISKLLEETDMKHPANDEPDAPVSDSQTSDKSSSSFLSDSEDFVMVDLNPAFAKSETSGDLANFYLTFQAAPELELFKDQPTLGEVLEKHIPEQLELYEKNKQEFDNLVESLRVADDEDEDSG